MKTALLALALATCLTALCDPASADMILGTSGWSVSSLNGRVDIDVEVVAEDAQSVTLRIEKIFGEALLVGGELDFPVGLLQFTRIDPAAVGAIVIQEEDVTNNTGWAWTAFEWNIFQGGSAVFDAAASAGWTVAPEFAGWTPSVPSGSGHLTIAAGGGPGVPDGGEFEPSGGLVIAATGDFVLKEQVVPEPSTMLVLLAGAAWLRRRRR